MAFPPSQSSRVLASQIKDGSGSIFFFVSQRQSTRLFVDLSVLHVISVACQSRLQYNQARPSHLKVKFILKVGSWFTCMIVLVGTVLRQNDLIHWFDLTWLAWWDRTLRSIFFGNSILSAFCLLIDGAWWNPPWVTYFKRPLFSRLAFLFIILFIYPPNCLKMANVYKKDF